MHVIVAVTTYLLIGIIVTIIVGMVRDFVVEMTKIRTRQESVSPYAAVTTTTYITSWTIVVFTWVTVIILSGLVVNIPKTAITGIVTAIFAAVGLGSQKIIGDIMAGFTMLIERQARVGDQVSVSVDGQIETGMITKITLRTMSIATDLNGIVIIPNGKITYIVNETITAGRFLVSVPFAVDSKSDKIEEVIKEAIARAKSTPEIRDNLVDDGITSRRVTKLSTGVIEASFVGSTVPGAQYETKRRLNEIVVDIVESTDGVSFSDKVLS